MNKDTKFINLTTENLHDEHVCCIIRSKNHERTGGRPDVRILFLNSVFHCTLMG